MLVFYHSGGNTIKEIRRSKIADILREDGYATVRDLSDRFNVSSVTIYRDFDYLEKKDILKRLRGGAVATPSREEVCYPFRASSCIDEKRKIARAVTRLLNTGDTVLLDGSTTNIFVARQMKLVNDLTVFTTSPMVMYELLNHPNIILYCVGGLYSNEIAQFVGSDVEDYISTLHVTKCIIGASAVSSEYGVTGPYPQFASIQKKIIQVSSEIILAADHTKFGKVAREKVIDIEAIDHIVVDSGIDERYLTELRDKTNVIVAE